MEEKVYCKYCKHYRGGCDEWGHGWCKEGARVQHMWRRPYRAYPDPEKKNEHNDCEGYEPSRWVRWFGIRKP